jgi:hypothetical protein
MLRRARAIVCVVFLLIASAAEAEDYQVIDVQPGQTVDVYFQINLEGSLALRILTKNGAGCAELWWIRWPLGNIRSLGRRCGAIRLTIPGFSDFSVAAKLRASGVSAPTKIIAASTERVANSITLHW